MKLILRLFLFASITVLFVLTSCKKNKFITDGSAKLEFNTDTVMFDTVFTGIGSATRFFIVRNKHELPINISEIKLATGESSKYRLNINGTPGNYLNDIEIAGQDSIFIFVDVNIDPSNDDIIEYDRIIFTVNENKQAVHLTAFGQNVHFLNDSVIDTQTWINDKPYLIYNSMALNENEVLTIEEGVKIYSHRNSRIYILGTLNVLGTYNNPVIFEADRLNGHSSIFLNDSTDNYSDISGQWGGIWLTKFSKNNYINYAEIKNAIIGIQVDSTGDSNFTQLEIHNTKLEHHSYAGILTQESSVFATNCLITDCGYYNIALTRGGNYEFYHSTIGNYWRGVRQAPSVYLNNYFQYDGTVYIYPLVNAYFGNCIIWGNDSTEIGIEQHEAGETFNYLFDNCVLRIAPTSDINTTDIAHFKNNIINEDPLFADYYAYDFILSELSPAINTGNFEITNLYPALLNTDLNNQNRVGNNSPDIGCYEFVGK
ncbi:MAG: hypothetical protein L3J35_12015 [Bacteroidales bacterium]|nr:hypothetical protein [Bacteroidales bacterium]